MERASLHSLPYELHATIMKHLLSYSQRYVRRSMNRAEEICGVSADRPEEPEWIEEDCQSSSLFPYNVASAWDVWRDVLVQIPQCWTRVVFDVANDPAALLDVFAWSKELVGVEVVIYNSSQSAEANAAEEAQRVWAIFKALFPHIPRCRSINANTWFSTSLPRPNLLLQREAPHLEQLTLESSYDNIDLNKVPPAIPQFRLHSSFPKLKVLSLTAFWFLYLVQNAHTGPLWLEELETREEPTFGISCFAFPQDGKYSLRALVEYLSVMRSWEEFHLVRLSLAYEFNSSVALPAASCDRLILPDLRFRDVSKSFLSHFDSLLKQDTPSIEYLLFEKCEMPSPLQSFSPDEALTLAEIIDNNDGTSIRNALDCCGAREVTIDNCPSFKEDDLWWLVTPRECSTDYGITCKQFPAWDLMILHITDCPPISPSILVEILKTRYNSDLAVLPEFNLGEVHVRGRGLSYLTEVDRVAFKGLWTSLEVQVSWTIIQDDDKVCYQFLNWGPY